MLTSKYLLAACMKTYPQAIAKIDIFYVAD